MTNPISPWPSFSEEEAEAVKQVLLTNNVNYWTGDEVKSFEHEYSGWVGSKYAIALANGTVALECALEAMGIGAGDEIIVTPRTFFASVSAIVRVGARPVFADVHLYSQNITAETISEVLTSRTKAIVVVHLAGQPAEMDEIMELSQKHNLWVLEDCAQAHGAKYKNKSVGTIGHVGAWSFCQDKIITTGGEGGMVTTDDNDLWLKMWSLKDHGKNYRAVHRKTHPNGFRWLHEGFGTNWRMTEMQAAIGRIQLKKVDKWVDKRRRNSFEIDKVLKGIKLVTIYNAPDYIKASYYKYYFFIKSHLLGDGWSRDRIIEEIVKLGIPCFQGSCPEVYLEKAFAEHAYLKRLKNAKHLGENSIMLLVHPTLASEEISKTCEVLQAVLLNAQR